jgi:hypothetical protein
MKAQIKKLIENELKTCHVAKGLTTDGIRLNSDLGIAIIENVVKKLLIQRASEKLCDCENPKYVLNEVKQELICKCGKSFNVC